MDCLKKQPTIQRDLTIEEIADLTGIHRNTVSKYVYHLEKEGKIATARQVGSAKLYALKEDKG